MKLPKTISYLISPIARLITNIQVYPSIASNLYAMNFQLIWDAFNFHQIEVLIIRCEVNSKAIGKAIDL